MRSSLVVHFQSFDVILDAVIVLVTLRLSQGRSFI